MYKLILALLLLIALTLIQVSQVGSGIAAKFKHSIHPFCQTPPGSDDNDPPPKPSGE